jgi:hypothetical protein
VKSRLENVTVVTALVLNKLESLLLNITGHLELLEVDISMVYTKYLLPGI